MVDATSRKKPSMYSSDLGSYCIKVEAQFLGLSGQVGGGRPTSTWYTSPPSWKELFIWPSGRRPLGKRERRTNSGNVSSSSLESVNFVPLVKWR